MEKCLSCLPVRWPGVKNRRRKKEVDLEGKRWHIYTETSGLLQYLCPHPMSCNQVWDTSCWSCSSHGSADAWVGGRGRGQQPPWATALWPIFRPPLVKPQYRCLKTQGRCWGWRPRCLILKMGHYLSGCEEGSRPCPPPVSGLLSQSGQREWEFTNLHESRACLFN